MKQRIVRIIEKVAKIIILLTGKEKQLRTVAIFDQV